jgi:PAS domain S-box-containing protein
MGQESEPLGERRYEPLHALSTTSHAARLQALAARLVMAVTPDDIIQAVFAEGFAAVGATEGSVVRLDGEELEILAATGYPADVVRRWQRFSLAASTPLSTAARTGEGVWVESPDAFQRRFLRSPDPDALAISQAWVALPLRASDRVLGAIGLSYPQPQTFDEETRRFTMTLADLCAQALERSWLFAALQTSEARFRTIVEATAQIIWTARPDGTFAGRQESWERFTGQRPQEYADGGGFAAIHPEDRAAVLEQWRQVLRTPAPFDLAYRLRHHDGSYRYVRARGTPILAPDGTVVEWVGVAEDRTERRRRELNTAFLAAIGEELAQLDDDRAIMRVAGELIAAHLQVWRCQFTEFDLVEDRATVIYAASAGSQVALRGTSYPISAFIGLEGVAQLAHGRQLVVADTATNPVIVATAERLAQVEVGALIITPYRSGGRWVAALTVHERGPRAWYDDELALLRELAERSWTRIERARAAAALREREAQLSAFMANSPGSLFVKDRAGRYTAVNDAFLTATGRTAAEVIGKADHELFAPELAELFVAEDEQVRASGEPASFEETFTFAGREYTFLSQKFPLPGGGIGGIGTDITERKLAEAAQRDYTRRLQQLNAASLAINTAPTREALLQQIADAGRALIGAHMAVVNLAPGGDWSQVQTVVSLAAEYSAWNDYAAPSTGEGIYRLAYDEQRTLRLTQAELEAHPAWRALSGEGAGHPPLDGLLAAPLIDGDGKSIGVVQLSAKVAGEFSPADEALLQQLAQLAAVALENQTLYENEQAARKEAEQANRLKDEFLATVSHELRTPLTALIGYAQLLRARKRDEEYIARTIAKIERSAKDQALIVEDLLDISRIVSGKLRIEPAPIDLVAVVQAALDSVRPTVEAKRLQLAVEFDAADSTVLGDASRLQQVVWNLLSNAAKFTPEGGSIVVHLSSTGRDAELAVRDSGRGISPTFLPFVFDRFRQADSASNRASGGLGLGLAIVRHLVELHGGTVRVASDGEGKGATFTLRLPLARARGAAAPRAMGDAGAEPADPFPPELQGLRVLLVDDHPAILELLDEVLSLSGVVVQRCDNARDALSTLQQWRPDVLVADLAMPGEDGYWLIGEVRALPAAKGGNTPALALTAYVRPEERVKVLAAGFQLFVPKPVEPAELRSALAHVVRG